MRDIEFIDPYRKIYETVPIQTIRMHFASIFGKHLTPIGFIPLRDQVWVRDISEEFQQIILMDRIGLRNKVYYGIRLRFSPTVIFQKNDRVIIRNHRNSDPDLAMLDLRIDPYNGAVNNPSKRPLYDIDGGNGLKFCLEDIHRECKQIMPLARQFFDTSTTIHEVLSWYEQAKARSVDGLDFENIIPHLVSYPFILAKCGKTEHGRTAFDTLIATQLKLDDQLATQLTDRFNKIIC